jgi:hypothetical protein
MCQALVTAESKGGLIHLSADQRDLRGLCQYRQVIPTTSLVAPSCDGPRELSESSVTANFA